MACKHSQNMSDTWCLTYRNAGGRLYPVGLVMCVDGLCPHVVDRHGDCIDISLGLYTRTRV